jgi:hypothetical protein
VTLVKEVLEIGIGSRGTERREVKMVIADNSFQVLHCK